MENPSQFNNHKYKLQSDAFWEFVFSAHHTDRKRTQNLLQIIAVFERHGTRLHYGELCRLYARQFDEQITPAFLRQLFCGRVLPEGYEQLVFKNCAPVFGFVEPDLIFYTLPDKMEPEDIFKSSTGIFNTELAKNLRLADRVFDIVPTQRPIELKDLMEELMQTAEYKGLKKKAAEAPPLEPIKFIGFLQMYWGDVFKIIPDQKTRQVWVKRHVLHHQRPSQDKQLVKEIMQARLVPSFPLPSDMLTRGHAVKIHPTSIPSDGIAIQLVELEKDFKHVREKLKIYYQEVMGLEDKDERQAKKLHPNETFEGTACLRTCLNEEDEEVFRRCQITGQSNGLAMVQDTDFPRIGLEDPKNLYKIPHFLVGIRQTCVYGVFGGILCDTENENLLWRNAMAAMRTSHSNIAHFQRVADRGDYSGRRKRAIFMCQIQVNQLDEKLAPKIFPRDIGS